MAIDITYPFVPHQIIELGVSDIVDITGEDRNDILEKLKIGYGNAKLVEKWLSTNPTNKEERDLYYRTAYEYLYDLCAYNAWEETLIRYNSIVEISRGKKVLDFGGGIGTLSLLLYSLGIDTTYYDLGGCNSDFAIKRFKKYNTNIKWCLDDYRKIKETFDVIVFFDVLEHLEDPVRVVKDVSGLLSCDGGLIYIFAPFSAIESHPMHLIPNGKKYIDFSEFDKELKDNNILKIGDFIYKVVKA